MRKQTISRKGEMSEALWKGRLDTRQLAEYLSIVHSDILILAWRRNRGKNMTCKFNGLIKKNYEKGAMSYDPSI